MNNRKNISRKSHIKGRHPSLCVWLCLTAWFAIYLNANANEMGFQKYRDNVLDQIEESKEALEKDPLNAKAHFQLGLSYMSLGRHREEIAEYLEAIRLEPDFADAHFNLAQSYDLLDDGARSIRHMLRARQIYTAHRNHRGIRISQRQLRVLYDKYGSTEEN